MKKSFLAALLIVAATSILPAQVIDRATAERIAAGFLGVDAVELAHLEGTASLPLVYIFNAADAQGSVEVAGDERALRPVLGYSRTAHIEWESANANFRALVTDMAKGMEQLIASPDIQQRISLAKAKGRRHPVGEPEEVAPLLTCAWAQDWPYNNLAPEEDGMRSMTGCVATAIAQVMYYHKWPAKGRGTVSYEWMGQTLTADLSQSTYRWEFMQDVYADPSTCSQESVDAVALLMHDVGYAMKMDYHPYGSGAYVDFFSLMENFDYDADLKRVRPENVSMDGYIAILRTELLAERPVLAAGDGHQYVIDGFDRNGYFHYNLGWGPDTDEYLLIDGTGYTAAELVYDIKPNQGGTGDISLRTLSDLKWTGEGDWVSSGAMPYSECASVTVEVTMAVENTATGEVSYLPVITQMLPPNGGMWVPDYEINLPLADGTYTIYPLARRQGDAEWRHFTYSADKHGSLTLTVKEGIKSYEQFEFLIDGVRYRLSTNDHTVSVVGHTNQDSIVVVDAIDVNGESWPVTTIAEGAFATTQATTIVVGSNVREIGRLAFCDSPNLTTVDIPESVEFIGDDAFIGCPCIAHTDGVIYSGNYLIGVANREQTSYIIRPGTTKIATYAFVACPNVTAFDIPEGVTTIGAEAFEACWNLQSVSMPSTVTSIGQSAFKSCEKITTLYWDTDLSPWIVACNCDPTLAEVHFGAHVNTIADNALLRLHALRTVTFAEGLRHIGFASFMECDALETITLPATLETLDAQAFFNCSSLTSIIIPDSVRSIGTHAFYGCLGLKSVVLGAGIREMGDGAFSNCISLSTLTISEGLTTIGNYAFGGCSSLENLVLPTSLTSLGEQAFWSCTGLSNVWFLSPEPPANNYSFLGCDNLDHIYVLDVEAYTAAFPSDAERVCPMIIVADTIGSTYPGMTCTMSDIAAEPGTYTQPLTITYEFNGHTYTLTIDYTYTIIGLTTIVQAFEGGQVQIGEAPVAATHSVESLSGSQLLLTAIPSEGYVFSYWQDEQGNRYTDNPLNYTVTGDVTLTAYFTLQTYTINVLATSGGQAYMVGDNTYGSQLLLTAIPSEGNVFSYWQDEQGNRYTDNPLNYTVTGGVMLTAVFDIDPNGIMMLDADDFIGEYIYDLQGRRVLTPLKGIYIVNGRKVYVK